MGYLVFDLDSTLVNFTKPVWLILDILQPIASSSWKKQPEVQTSDEYKESIALAYKALVQLVGKEEMGQNPIGILRPGILRVLKEILELRAKNKVKGVIMYTNNSHGGMVYFAKDVLEFCIGGNLFDDCMFVHHPLRMCRPKYPDMIKTWTTMRDLLIQGINAPKTIQPKDVLFYDDQHHADLMNVLRSNYIKVPAYDYVPNTKRFINLILHMLENFKIFQEETPSYNDFKNVLRTNLKITDDAALSKQDIIEKLHIHLGYETPQIQTPVPSEDAGIEMIIKSINPADKYQIFRKESKRTKQSGVQRRRKGRSSKNKR